MDPRAAGLATDEFPPVALPGLALAVDPFPVDARSTVLLDWDRDRHPGPHPRRLVLPADDAGPTWISVPHARYVLCVRHSRGRAELVYVMSLVGRRDSLIPAGAVDSIVSDDRSVTIVVDGRPYLYAVESGVTMDVTTRRALGGTSA